MRHPAITSRLPLLAVGLAVVLWSTAFGVSGEVLATASPAVLSVLRFIVALIVLVPFAVRRPGFGRTLRQPRTVLLGLFGVSLYYSLTNISLEFTEPGTIALTNAALPAMTAVLGAVVLRERISRRTAVGLVFATAGVAIVAGGGLSINLGVLLCLIGLAAYALYTVLLRKYVVEAEAVASTSRTVDASPDPLVLATATAIWGTAIMLPWLAVEVVTGGASWPSGWGGIGGVLFLGMIVTAPTLWLFNYGAERLPAAVTGVLTAAIPALGYLFALLLGEPLDLLSVLGGSIALVGVFIATTAAPALEASPVGSVTGADTFPVEHDDGM